MKGVQVSCDVASNRLAMQECFLVLLNINSSSKRKKNCQLLNIQNADIFNTQLHLSLVKESST